MPGDSKYAYNPMNNPYVDRDARLNYTILHNGSTWLGKQLETYQGGTHNPSGAQYSQTSYYMCKFMGKYDANRTDYDGDMLHLWVMYRYIASKIFKNNLLLKFCRVIT